jgi:hypothetical protein
VSEWLVYYDNGECVAGQCAWEAKYHYCGGVFGSGCAQGACVGMSITAQAPL